MIKLGGKILNKELIKINTIRKYIKQRKINWTRHCLNKMSKRGILIEDVKIVINNGSIIEYYYDDYPYPSCLILGKDSSNKNIHIVCGINEGYVYIITAYYHNIDKWEKDMKTRREK